MKKLFLIALLCLLNLNLQAYADSQSDKLARLGVQIPNGLKTGYDNSEVVEDAKRQRTDYFVKLERKWCEEWWEQGRKDVTWDMVNGKCIVPELPPSPQIMNVNIMGPGTSKTWGTAYIY